VQGGGGTPDNAPGVSAAETGFWILDDSWLGTAMGQDGFGRRVGSPTDLKKR